MQNKQESLDELFNSLQIGQNTNNNASQIYNESISDDLLYQTNAEGRYSEDFYPEQDCTDTINSLEQDVLNSSCLEPVGEEHEQYQQHSTISSQEELSRQKLLDWLKSSQAKRDENNRQIFSRWKDKTQKAQYQDLIQQSFEYLSNNFQPTPICIPTDPAAEQPFSKLSQSNNTNRYDSPFCSSVLLESLGECTKSSSVTNTDQQPTTPSARQHQLNMNLGHLETSEAISSVKTTDTTNSFADQAYIQAQLPYLYQQTNSAQTANTSSLRLNSPSQIAPQALCPLEQWSYQFYRPYYSPQFNSYNNNTSNNQQVNISSLYNQFFQFMNGNINTLPAPQQQPQQQQNLQYVATPTANVPTPLDYSYAVLPTLPYTPLLHGLIPSRSQLP